MDKNHSHFILVDDGSENSFGKEIEFRAKLEAYIGLLDDLIILFTRLKRYFKLVTKFLML